MSAHPTPWRMGGSFASVHDGHRTWHVHDSNHRFVCETLTEADARRIIQHANSQGGAPDGGPAFPRPEAAGIDAQDGMTLRDYFAGQALAGALANSRDFSECSKRDIADFAYGQADAMLAAREKGGAA